MSNKSYLYLDDVAHVEEGGIDLPLRENDRENERMREGKEEREKHRVEGGEGRRGVEGRSADSPPPH